MRRLIAAAAAILAVVAFVRPAGADAPYRAFTADSYWNTPVPGGADVHNGAYLKWLKANASKGITLGMGDWAMPVYWAKASDPLVTIDPKNGPTVTFHAPAMQPMAGNDAALVVFDPTTDQSVQLFEYDPSTQTATATARYWLDGNGIADGVDGQNVGDQGHRGIPGAVHMVRYDEVAAGLIAHRLKVALPGTGSCGVYPMDGYEKNKGGIVCEGMVMHIKRSVDLVARGYTGAALVIATAMQQYGAIVGDNGGGSKVSLKMQQADYSALGLKAGSLWAHLSWSDFVFAPGGWHE